MWELGGRLIVWGTLELVGPGGAHTPWLAVALGLIVIGKSGGPSRKSGERDRDRNRDRDRDRDKSRDRNRNRSRDQDRNH